MWISPEYKKKRVGKAGEVLIGESFENLTADEALIILSNWRSSHAYPLNSIQNSLRYKVKQIYKAKGIEEDYLIAQRLKRTSSIKNKLKRFPEMKLHRMQDIGGCRAILLDNKLIYQLKDEIVNKENFHIIKEYDYIQKPKDTGYKGIHLISEYCGRKESFEGLKIEIQLRSKLQHYWATGVEIIGTFTNQQLKAGIGEQKWLLFFQLVSSLISNLENNEPINAEKARNLKQLDEELKVLEKLTTYTVFANFTEQIEKTKGRFLLMLDIDNRTVNIENFNNNQL